MIRSKYNFCTWVLGLFSLLAGGCGLCLGSFETYELKSGTYQTLPKLALTFPVSGIKQKIMVYDKQTNKLTITYTAENKIFVETWTVASMSQ